MKKILNVALLLLCVSFASAQTIMTIHLKDSTKAYYRVEKIDTVDFSALKHTFVDFHLPSGTLWATCNVGANKPEEYGDYFAWGETTPYKQTPKNYPSNWNGDTNQAYLANNPKDEFSWPNYMWGNDNYLFKYNNKEELATPNSEPDYQLRLKPEDDAAAVYWGQGWHTPTYEQVEELLHYCLCTWVLNYCNTGVNGLLVLEKNEENKDFLNSNKKFNGNLPHIFMPAAGDIDFDYLSNPNNCGFYWTSDLSAKDPKMSKVLDFNSNGLVAPNLRSRSYGRSVRPVF